MLSSKPFLRRIWTRLALAWLFFLLLLIAYWMRLDYSHKKQLDEAQLQAQLRANQAAHALSMEVRSQLLGIDFVLEHLIEHWQDHDEAVFRKLIGLAQQGIFKDSLDVIIVTDAAGKVLFNSHTQSGQPASELSVARRDYFQQLAQRNEPSFLISRPVHNVVTNQWTVQFSHNMLIDGKFAGIILASVPAEHLAEAFRQVYPDHSDVVLLTLNDGQYLARTHALDDSLTKKVPADREFLQQPEKLSGHYNAVAPIDSIERFYAWHRIPGFPVVLSLGLGKDKILLPTQLSIKASKTQNLLATILLLLAALWITRLVAIKAKQNQALLQTQERLATLLIRVPSGVLLEDESNHIVTANPTLLSLLSLDVEPSNLIGLHHSQLLTMLGQEQAAWLPMARNNLKQRQLREVKDSAGRTFEIDWVPIRRDFRSLGHVWFIQDISERKKKEQELVTLATTDALTGLHNRRSFLDILQQQLKLSKPHWPGALLLLDIDHFKRVNDTYGHPAGDLVIRNIAQGIRDSLRQDDITGRLGGEEFAVLLPKATLQQAQQLAERIREHVAATPTITHKETIYVTISIGVALLYGQDENSVQSQADQALYQAKNSGRNRVCCAEHEADEAVQT